MLDLNRINGGMKLLKYILKTEVKKRPWSKEQVVKQAQKQPNPYTPKTRPIK